MTIYLFAAESILLRVEKLKELKGYDNNSIYQNILDVYIYEAAANIYKAGSDAINSFTDGEEFARLHKALQYYTHVEPINIKEARRKIADKLIEDNKYNF
jgi:hypothetical protein